MLIACLAILAGIALLLWSADKFVIGAASMARNMGMSAMMIGLTMVSLGTSAPEILVSITASSVGASGLAVGNALGSNIANIGLVLGVTALIAPLPVKSELLRRELPILAAVTLGAGLCLLDLNLGMIDGLALLAGLVITLALFARYNPGPKDEKMLIEEEHDVPELPLKTALFWFISGLVLLISSSRLLVWAATDIAQFLGVSDLIIGLTIVAIGTSLPELAASATSALKGHHDIAIGNVIGSNIFNLLAVMSLPGIINPYNFDAQLLWRDYGLMAVLTALLIVFSFSSLKHGDSTRIGRFKGTLFCAAYVSYLVMLYVTT